MDKRYDRAAFIQAYIAIKEPQGHEDFTRFTAARLAALEQAFDLRLTWEGVTHQDNSVKWTQCQAQSMSHLSVRS